MSSCVSGGAAYSLELETVKSPPLHNTPSPSSTISESNSSPPLAISTKRPRTLRKRPNQTYDEAAALLSTAYPNIFSSKKQKTHNFGINFGIKSPISDYDEASQLLLPYESIEEPDFVFNTSIQINSDHLFEPKEVNFDDLDVRKFGLYDDFDAESILDEETAEGINSFMGNIESNGGENKESSFSGRLGEEMKMRPWYGSYSEFGFVGDFKLGLGLRSSLRENDDYNWWKFPTVDFEQISPRIQNTAVESNLDNTIVTKVRDKKRKKTMKKVALEAVELKSSEDLKSPDQKLSPLYLKLDYDGVLNAWADKESPFSDDILCSYGAGIDLHARLSEIDLFGESGMREVSVLRYKEKRRNRLFSNKIRYQVRKLNADQRLRIKGRFVRRPKTRNVSVLRFQHDDSDRT